jgi:hypothetical protein
MFRVEVTALGAGTEVRGSRGSDLRKRRRREVGGAVNRLCL